MFFFASEKIAYCVWTMALRNFEIHCVSTYNTENVYEITKILAICKYNFAFN